MAFAPKSRVLNDAEWGERLSIRQRQIRTLTRSVTFALAFGCASTANAQGNAWRFNQSLAVTAPSASLAPLRAANMVSLATWQSMNLGQWQEMTRAALMPSFGHRLGGPTQVDTSMLADHEHLFVPEFAESWIARHSSNTVISFDFTAARVPETPLLNELGALVPRPGDSVGTLDRIILAPGVGHRLSNDSVVDVAAVLATQRFTSLGLGAQVFDESSGRYVENSVGAGLRLGWSNNLTDTLMVRAAVQSRVDMDEFQGYRGLFFEPGDFDIPATARVGLAFEATDSLTFNVDAQRVMYSDISAVTSELLPDSIVALLGDSSSPEFAWSDLTVWRLGLGLRTSEDRTYRVDLSTSQQPRPTAASLARAIEDEYDDGNVTLGMTQRTSANAWLDIRASYAPSQYLVAISPVAPDRPDPDEELIEFELLWTTHF